jgi:hypothetical protein
VWNSEKGSCCRVRLLLLFDQLALCLEKRSVNDNHIYTHKNGIKEIKRK